MFAVLDNVGGRTLSQAYALLEPGGCAQSVGMASLEPTSIDFEQARLRGGGLIEAFTVGDHFGPDLSYLIGLVAAGELDPQVGWRGPWQKAADAALKWVDGQMTPADLVAVAAINSSLQVLTDFTSDKEQVRSALSAFSAAEGTAFAAVDASTASTDEAPAAANTREAPRNPLGCQREHGSGNRRPSSTNQ